MKILLFVAIFISHSAAIAGPAKRLPASFIPSDPLGSVQPLLRQSIIQQVIQQPPVPGGGAYHSVGSIGGILVETTTPALPGQVITR